MTTRTLLHGGQFLQFWREGKWEYVDRCGCRGAVTIVACTPAHEAILIEQYRTALHAPVIEWPAGLVGDAAGGPEESFEASARRELLEETGYAARNLVRAFAGPLSPGMSSEQIECFVARDAVRVGHGGGDGDERITVHTVPLATVRTWLDTQAAAGKLIDAKIYAGLYWLSSINVSS